MTEKRLYQRLRNSQASQLSKQTGRVMCISLAICLLLFAGSAVHPVFAQAIPTVGFSPVPAVIDTRVGDTTIVDVVVENAVNIGGFDVQIDYDPNIARIAQWELGSFFSSGFCLELVNQPGTLKLACSKYGTPGTNGSGTLLRLTFKAFGWSGNTKLTLSNAQLVESENYTIIPVMVVPGELKVIPYHIALPLILKQGSPLTNMLPAESFAQAASLQTTHEYTLALPGPVEAQS